MKPSDYSHATFISGAFKTHKQRCTKQHRLMQREEWRRNALSSRTSERYRLFFPLPVTIHADFIPEFKCCYFIGLLPFKMHLAVILKAHKCYQPSVISRVRAGFE